jgi:hypothetical protein
MAHFEESQGHQFIESRAHQRMAGIDHVIDPPPPDTAALQTVIAHHSFVGRTAIPAWQRGTWWRNVCVYEIPPYPDPPTIEGKTYSPTFVGAAYNDLWTGELYFVPDGSLPAQDFRVCNQSGAGGMYLQGKWRMTVSDDMMGDPPEGIEWTPHEDLIPGWLEITWTQHRHGQASGSYGTNVSHYKVEDDVGILYEWTLNDDGTVDEVGPNRGWGTTLNVQQWNFDHISGGANVGWDFYYQELVATANSVTLDTDATWGVDQGCFHVKYESLLEDDPETYADGKYCGAAIAYLLAQVNLQQSDPSYPDGEGGTIALGWQECVDLSWAGPQEASPPVPLHIVFALGYPDRSPPPPYDTDYPWNYRFQNPPPGTTPFTPGEWFLLNWGWTYNDPGWQSAGVPQSAWAESAKSIAAFLPGKYVYGWWDMKQGQTGTESDGSDGWPCYPEIVAPWAQYEEVEYTWKPFRRIYFPPLTNGARQIQQKYAEESHSDAPPSNAD